MIEMVVVMKGDGDIETSDLPSKILRGDKKDEISGNLEIPDEGLNFKALVEQFERDLLIKALSKAGGAKKGAAKLLRLNRTTLVEKLKRLNIGKPGAAV